METSSSDRYAPSAESVVESSQPSPRKDHFNRGPYDQNETQSASQNEDPPATKKRKRAISTITHRSISNVQQSYRGGYHELFNDVVEEAASECALDESLPLESSLIGIVAWSSEEKNIFFSALARHGRNDLKAITDAIGTKSEPEVQAYLQILQDKLLEYARDDAQNLVKDTDIPAAYQISRKCGKQLDMAADALASKQTTHEMSVEQARYGDYWLLNQQTSDVLDDRRVNIDATRDDGAVRPDLEAACEVLNIRNMLKLSSRIFMNSTDLEYNWCTYSAPGELPSIFSTAFVDLHRLVLGILRRLISSTLFFAMSRIRAKDNSYTHPRPHVRQQDVYAALDVTSMNLDARGYWIKLARRCKLEVCEGSLERESRRGDTLSYEEVEEKLREPMTRDTSPTTPLEEAEMDVSLSPPSHSDNSSNADAGSIEEAQTGSNSRNASTEGTEDEDAYVEAIDTRASRAEERRLWDLLEMEPPDHLWKKTPVPSVEPTVSSRVEQNSGDWRNWIDYRSEWETYDSPIGNEAFKKNRQAKKKRRYHSSADSEDGEQFADEVVDEQTRE